MGVSLKEVVVFIQTNLIKLYVEKYDYQSIYKFFSSATNRNQIHVDYNEIDKYLEVNMSKNEDKKAMKTISEVTMALIYENLGKLEKALAYWRSLKNEEGCQKTVSILKKKEITNK